MTTLTTVRGQALRRFLRHYLEMIMAMVVGMVVLGAAVAMYLPFVALFVPLWLGVLSPTGLMVLGHVLMLFAMAAVMWRRRDEYASHHHRKAQS
jgi:hypothetical protein